MIYAGKQITNPADELVKVSLDYICNSIKNPKKDIEAKIRQLRVIRDIDLVRYKQLKKELPYLVCGTFNPPFRRIENFAYIEYFIVDIDHISIKGLSIESIRHEIEKDERTIMSFLSPGEDGLKIMFRLKERCYDHGLYSLFYKIFVKQLAEKFHLEQVIDSKTCDVSRACFISCDSNVYYRPLGEPLDINAYMDVSNTASLFEIKKQMEKESKEANNTAANDVDKLDRDPDKETILKIKEILRLQPKRPEKMPVYVPEQLDEVIGDIKKKIEETGIQLSEIINIYYGKKLRLKLGLKQAEINLFYGKRGFSVVKSPRCGTNPELNDLSAELINSILSQL